MTTYFRALGCWLAVVAGCHAATLPAKESNAILENGLSDKNPDIRKEAVIALSLAPSRGPLAEKLESMLSDKDVQVRLATIASLEDLKSGQTKAALRQALDDPVPEVSFAAAKALFELHDPAGESALLAVLRGETKTSSGFLSKEMRNAIRMMHTPKTTFMFALRQGAAFAPVPGVGAGVASLQGLLSDANVSGRATAALLLGRERSRPARQALQEALSDKDWSVRAAAIHSLALWNDRTLRPDFAHLLDDEKEPVRLRAAAAWLRLGVIVSSRAQPGSKPPSMPQ